MSLDSELRWKELMRKIDRLQDEGKYADAVPIAEEAIKVAESSFGLTHVNVATSLDKLALLFFALNKYSEAETLARWALDVKEKSLDPDHPDVANSLLSVASYCRHSNKAAEAEPFLRRALIIKEKSLGPMGPQVAATMECLTECCKAQGKQGESEALVERALEIWEKDFIEKQKTSGLNYDQWLVAAFNLANRYTWYGKHDQAESLYQRAPATCEDFRGAPIYDSLRAGLLQGYAALLRRLGKTKEAEALEFQAKEIREQLRTRQRSGD